MLDELRLWVHPFFVGSRARASDLLSAPAPATVRARRHATAEQRHRHPHLPGDKPLPGLPRWRTYMDQSLIKRLVLPPGRAAGASWTYEELAQRADTAPSSTTTSRGINASLDLIRRPAAAVADRAGDEPSSTTSTWSGTSRVPRGRLLHLRRLRADGGYLGCAYLYPLGRRTPLERRAARATTSTSAGG